MTTKIAIIGLGQIGTSVGLALKARGGPENIVGFDRERKAIQGAEYRGAIDASGGLKSTARDADIVFLCLPLGEIQETLRGIGTLLKDGAVVVDTSPSKVLVNNWFNELVPAGRYYIGLGPSINPSMLGGSEVESGSGHAEFFKRSVMMVVVPAGAEEAVEQLGMNIARLLGAKPMLTGLAECDGIMTAIHVLPQLAAGALIEASMTESGWRDARKVAGRPYTTVTGGLAYFDDPTSVETAVLSNPDRVVHALDVVIASLRGLRDDIHDGEGRKVRERLAHSWQAREQWLDERNEASWLTEGFEPVQLPGLEQQLMQMFFGGRLAERMNQLDEKRKDLR
jgi:prephenate dehydrogenase